MADTQKVLSHVEFEDSIYNGLNFWSHIESQIYYQIQTERGELSLHSQLWLISREEIFTLISTQKKIKQNKEPDFEVQWNINLSSKKANVVNFVAFTSHVFCFCRTALSITEEQKPAVYVFQYTQHKLASGVRSECPQILPQQVIQKMFNLIFLTFSSVLFFLYEGFL